MEDKTMDLMLGDTEFLIKAENINNVIKACKKESLL